MLRATHSSIATARVRAMGHQRLPAGRTVRVAASAPPPRASSALYDSLRGLLSQSHTSKGLTGDIYVTLAGTSFYLHGMILAARCPVLLYSLRSFYEIRSNYNKDITSQIQSQLEQIQTQLRDLGLSAPAFRLLLTHIYTGDTDFPREHVLPVTAAMKKLGMTADLDEMAANMLAAPPQPDTVVDQLLFARQQGFTALLDSRKEYFLDNTAAVLAADPDAMKALSGGKEPWDVLGELYQATLQRNGLLGDGYFGEAYPGALEPF